MDGWTSWSLDAEAQEIRAVVDAAGVRALCAELCEALELSLPCELEHLFQPQGQSHVRHGPQGRVALHTWPEWRLLTVDVWAPSAQIAAARDAALALLAQWGLHLRQERLQPARVPPSAARLKSG